MPKRGSRAEQAGQEASFRCVMNCHVRHAVAKALRFRSCISFLRRVPFRSLPSAPPPPGFPERRDPFCARIVPARPRASCAGAVRAPDCARETEGAPLLPVSQGVFENGAARPRNAGKAAPVAPSPAPIIHHFSQSQAPNGNKNHKYQKLFIIFQDIGFGARFRDGALRPENCTPLASCLHPGQL